MSEGILVVNAGSSSIKFAVYALEAAGQVLRYRGLAEGLGADGAAVEVRDRDGHVVFSDQLPRNDHAAAIDALMLWLERGLQGLALRAVGHRVVHGGPQYSEPVLLDDAVIEALQGFTPLAPLHQPQSMAPIRRLAALRPDMPQVACFDTAFHRTLPRVAQLFALPRKYLADGVIRYGFHGLSYQYIARWLATHRPRLYAGRVVVAHLGNGASLCGLQGGRSIATSMGFTTLDGLPMGRRSGSLDPGVVLYLLDHYRMSAAEVQDLLYNQSGLLGLSGISHDVRVLLASDRPAAREALEVYCYRTAREIGSMAAALQGLDGLVFTAGVGENAAEVRRLICEQLQWLGIRLNQGRNDGNALDIGADGSLPVMVVPTDEEGEIVRETMEKTIVSAV
ncbi:MAG: acetate/propionate family kinase [Aquisalimonadaceae bacterium]